MGGFLCHILATLRSRSNHRPANNQALITCYSSVKYESAEIFRVRLHFCFIFLSQITSTTEHIIEFARRYALILKWPSKSYAMWEMVKITWNAARLRNPVVLGDRLPITQTHQGLDSPGQTNKRQTRRKMFSQVISSGGSLCGPSLCGNAAWPLRSLWDNIGATAGSQVCRIEILRVEGFFFFSSSQISGMTWFPCMS